MPYASCKHYTLIRPVSKHDYPYFLDPEGAPVTSAYVNQKLQQCSLKAGFKSGRFSCHGFRAGKVTQMIREGTPIETVEKFGRWRSRAHLKYNRPKYVKA